MLLAAAATPVASTLLVLTTWPPLPSTAVDDVLALLAAGAKHRHTAATRVNVESSRSHCVFTCHLVSETRDEAGVVTRTSQVSSCAAVAVLLLRCLVCLLWLC